MLSIVLLYLNTFGYPPSTVTTTLDLPNKSISAIILTDIWLDVLCFVNFGNTIFFRYVSKYTEFLTLAKN